MPCHSWIGRVSRQFSSASPTRRSFIHRSVSQSRTSREFAFGFGTALPLEQLNSGSGVAVGVWVAVGVIVGVYVTVGVGVLVGDDVGVGVWVGLLVGVGLFVGVGVGIGVSVR